MNRYEKTWQERDNSLKKAGFKSYDEFLKSELWQSIKKKASSKTTFQYCWLCSRTDVDLHHLHYKRLTQKTNALKDIVPCCREHHKQIHDLAKAKKTSVKAASTQVMKGWLASGNIMSWLRVKIKRDPKCKKWNHLLKGKSIEPIFK